jgi:replicative DNA helicase
VRCATTSGGRLSEAVEKLGKVSLYIDESPALTPSEVRARARRQAVSAASSA